MKYYKTYNFSRASESWSRASKNWISLALRGKSLQKLTSCPVETFQVCIHTPAAKVYNVYKPLPAANQLFFCALIEYQFHMILYSQDYIMLWTHFLAVRILQQLALSKYFTECCHNCRSHLTSITSLRSWFKYLTINAWSNNSVNLYCTLFFLL